MFDRVKAGFTFYLLLLACSLAQETAENGDESLPQAPHAIQEGNPEDVQRDSRQIQVVLMEPDYEMVDDGQEEMMARQAHNMQSQVQVMSDMINFDPVQHMTNAGLGPIEPKNEPQSADPKDSSPKCSMDVQMSAMKNELQKMKMVIQTDVKEASMNTKRMNDNLRMLMDEMRGKRQSGGCSVQEVAEWNERERHLKEDIARLKRIAQSLAMALKEQNDNNLQKFFKIYREEIEQLKLLMGSMQGTQMPVHEGGLDREIADLERQVNIFVRPSPRVRQSLDDELNSAFDPTDQQGEPKADDDIDEDISEFMRGLSTIISGKRDTFEEKIESKIGELETELDGIHENEKKEGQLKEIEKLQKEIDTMTREQRERIEEKLQKLEEEVERHKHKKPFGDGESLADKLKSLKTEAKTLDVSDELHRLEFDIKKLHSRDDVEEPSERKIKDLLFKFLFKKKLKPVAAAAAAAALVKPAVIDKKIQFLHNIFKKPGVPVPVPPIPYAYHFQSVPLPPAPPLPIHHYGPPHDHGYGGYGNDGGYRTAEEPDGLAEDIRHLVQITDEEPQARAKRQAPGEGFPDMEPMPQMVQPDPIESEEFSQQPDQQMRSATYDFSPYEYGSSYGYDKGKDYAITKKSIVDKLIDKIINKVIKKVFAVMIKAFPVIIRRLFGIDHGNNYGGGNYGGDNYGGDNYGGDNYGDGPEGDDYGPGYRSADYRSADYGDDTQESYGAESETIPAALVSGVRKLADVLTTLRGNEFVKTFLVPAGSMILVNGLMVFLTWWLQPNGKYDANGYGQDIDYGQQREILFGPHNAGVNVQETVYDSQGYAQQGHYPSFGHSLNTNPLLGELKSGAQQAYSGYYGEPQPYVNSVK